MPAIDGLIPALGAMLAELGYACTIHTDQPDSLTYIRVSKDGYFLGTCTPYPLGLLIQPDGFCDSSNFRNHITILFYDDPDLIAKVTAILPHPPTDLIEIV